MRSGIRRRGGATSAAIALCLATGLAASSASAEPVDPTTPVTETVEPTTAPTTEPTDDGTAADDEEADRRPQPGRHPARGEHGQRVVIRWLRPRRPVGAANGVVPVRPGRAAPT